MKNLYTKALNEIDKNDFLLVGGKGMNLGKMISARLPVPSGFVVTTKGYEDFVRKNQLGDQIIQLVQDISAEDLKVLEVVSKEIEAKFTESAIPQDIIEEITENYKRMREVPVAVRSSATAEDLPGTSFAGQYDTFLNIKGVEALCEAVKKCWSSLWNARALSYRIKHGIKHEGLAHGVIVQELISGEKAGVLFTANPVNCRRDEMLINGSWGLGESIVSGEVSPDQWIIRWNGEVVEKYIAKKETMTVRVEKGTHSEEVPEELQEISVLSEKEVKQLLELGKKTKEYFGDHQDTEWVILDGKVYMVQARPITSLFPLVETNDDKLRVYMCFNTIGQGVYEPFTAMGQELYRFVYYALANLFGGKDTDPYPTWVKNVGGRVFIELSNVAGKKKTWKNLDKKFGLKDPIAGKAILQFLENNENVVLNQGLKFKMPPKGILYIMKLWKNVMSAARSPENAEKKIIELGTKVVNDIKQEAKKISTTEEKLQFISRKTIIVNDMMLKQIMYVLYVLKAIEKAKKLVSKWLDNDYDFEAICQYLPNNPTTQMGLELVKTAKKLEQRGLKATASQPEIKVFLDRYGHRAEVEIDMGYPRWKEEPEYVLELINSYIELGTIDENLKKFKEGFKKADEAIKQIVDDVRNKKGNGKAKKIEKMLIAYRRLAGLREMPKYNWVEAIAIFRELLLSIGEELVREGRLDQAKDVFHVKYKDIESGKKLQDVVRKNKEEYKKYSNIRSIPRFITSTGECIYSVKEKDVGNTLSGISVSPGIYEGTVRVVLDPKGARLEKGEILVTQSTNPAWTPLFLNAGALVMETGGPISHGSIVAREYGIPAVAGINEATTRLKDGQKIRVNGESGQVVIL